MIMTVNLLRVFTGRSLAIVGPGTFLAAVLLAPFILSPVLAQSGIIRGTVTDDKNRPVSEATIRIEGIDVRRDYRVTTNAKGEFIHIGVNLQGIYRVVAEKEGYESAFIEGVRPSLDRSGSAGVVDLVIRSGEMHKPGSATTGGDTAKVLQDDEEARRKAERDANLRSAFDEGVAAYNAGDFRTARDRFRKAVEIAPDEPVAWVNLAAAYSRLDEHESAVECYQKAIALKPDDPAFHQGLGNAWAALGKSDLAESSYARSVELKRGADPKAAAGAYYEQAIEFINSGDKKRAGETLRKALEADEGYSEAHFQLGLVLLGTEDHAEALKHLKRYLDLAPDGANAETARQLIGNFD